MIDDVFKALADPNRRRILRMLRHRDMTVGTIRMRLKITGPTLSHHLDTLRRAGLVTSEREGRYIRYSLDGEVLTAVLGAFAGLFGGRR